MFGMFVLETMFVECFLMSGPISLLILCLVMARLPSLWK